MATYGAKLKFWRAKVQEGLPPHGTHGRDNLLCDRQSQVHSAGYREAHLTETIFGYSVRLSSGIDSHQVLFGGRREGRTVPYEEALAWGKAWVDESPDFRALTYDTKCDGQKPYGTCTLNYHKTGCLCGHEVHQEYACSSRDSDGVPCDCAARNGSMDYAPWGSR